MKLPLKGSRAPKGCGSALSVSCNPPNLIKNAVIAKIWSTRGFNLIAKPNKGEEGLTGSELFDAALTGAGLHGQKVFEPGDLWVGDAAGGAQHGGRPGPFHHLQLGAHVDAGEAKRQQVLCKRPGGHKTMSTKETFNSRDSSTGGAFGTFSTSRPKSEVVSLFRL